MSTDYSRMKRPQHPMPDFVRQALEKQGMMKFFRERPAYQQNDYVGWIDRAKRPETKAKRLQQMLNELKTGGVYMNMAHPPSRRG